MTNISDNLRIKIVLDTQILAYLVDNTYPSLTLFVKTLSESPFVDIECSRFAIYEFIGIRKLEHYLRCLIKETEKKGGRVNFSSALKYKGDFNSEVKYIDAYEIIKSEVERELNEIYNDFGIIYEKINIHNNLWKPHQDLVLSTRISKEDSLLLLSSIYPNEFDKEQYLVLFTNDSQFYKAFNDSNTKNIKQELFSNHALIQPAIFNLKECKLEEGKTSINLTDTNDDDKIIDFVENFIFEHIKKKNKDILLGRIINCDCSKDLKKQVLCFRLDDNKQLVENMYISILYKKFKLYNHPNPLSEFWSHGKIDLPYKSNSDEKSKEISIKLTTSVGDNLEEKLMESIACTGNLVFIHPDSFI